MKKAVSFIAAIALILLVLFAFTKQKKKITDRKPDQKGFAVIELFTSEGCSSCPPADDAVAQIQKDYTDKNVLVLGYHVDYWDRLGWKDPFSSHEYTKRQNYYAGIFNLESIYTPQAIVNGEDEFVGSNQPKLTSAVEKELNGEKSASINLKSIQNTAGKIEIAYSSSENISKQEQVVLLLIQKMATDKIGRGENVGKTLHHINIVRDLSILPISSKEETKTFTIPSGLKKEDVFVAAFIQNKKTGKITGLQLSSID